METCVLCYRLCYRTKIVVYGLRNCMIFFDFFFGDYGKNFPFFNFWIFFSKEWFSLAENIFHMLIFYFVLWEFCLVFSLPIYSFLFLFWYIFTELLKLSGMIHKTNLRSTIRRWSSFPSFLFVVNIKKI